jgi:hypothetical protein
MSLLDAIRVSAEGLKACRAQSKSYEYSYGEMAADYERKAEHAAQHPTVFTVYEVEMYKTLAINARILQKAHNEVINRCNAALCTTP